MSFLTFKPFFGPKSFVFKDPDSGFKYHAATKGELIQRIVTYRSQNNLPPMEHLNHVLDNYWCNLPENKGSCTPNKALSRGMFQYMRGGIRLLQNLFYGEKNITNQEEADRRAAICVKCPFNVFPDKTFYQSWADEIAEASVGKRKSKDHDLLGNCLICSCPLRAKVFYNGKLVLKESERNQMKSVSCWQVEVEKKQNPKVKR